MNMSISDPNAMRVQVLTWKTQGDRILFVPTMGNLHEGHLQLIDHAKAIGGRIIVSIFVNPMQFAPGEDFDSYPRTVEADLAALKARGGVDAIFFPTKAQIYPQGTENTTSVSVPQFSHQLCAVRRPHFFGGIATVVMKLCQIVLPDVLILGEKDYQQLQVIKQMLSDLWLPIRVEGVPIVREASGLAMSSRNTFLSAEDKKTASVLYACLKNTEQALKAGHRDFSALCKQAWTVLKGEGLSPDYYTIRKPCSLSESQVGDTNFMVLAAANLASTRLIDNLRVRINN